MENWTACEQIPNRQLNATLEAEQFRAVMSKQKKELRFTRDGWVKTDRDAYVYDLYYEISSIKRQGPHEKRQLELSGQIRVAISRTLTSIWNMVDDEQLRRVLYDIGRRHVIDRIEDETLTGHDEIELTTQNADEIPPIDPDNVGLDFENSIEIGMPPEPPMTNGALSELAGEIIELRDNINALAGERYGCGMLSSPSERHLLNLFHECGNIESFVFRVASLAALATSFRTSDLRSKIHDTEVSKPIDVVGEFLRQHTEDDQKDVFMNTVSRLNRLRQMYPIHTDSPAVIRALRHFGIEYPVVDHNTAWKTLLVRYREALRALLELVRAPSEDHGM